jgi:1,4-alpha-glucan branching enzyme
VTLIRRTRVAKTNDVKLTFTLPQDEPAGDVSVVGTFNGWTPGKNRLVKRANGIRSAVITLPTGTTVRFRYLGEDGHWFDEPDADTIDSDGSVVRV